MIRDTKTNRIRIRALWRPYAGSMVEEEAIQTGKKRSWWRPGRFRRFGGRLIVPAPVVSGQRVSVALPGGELWFESDDALLISSIEAFAGVLLLPAMERGMTLQFEAPLNATWLAGARRNEARYREWWGHPVDPLAKCEHEQLASYTLADGRSTSGMNGITRRGGVCFTGGVDSFSELLRDTARFSHLVFLQGPDIALTDHVRAQSVRAMMDDVSSHLELKVLWVRSNVMQHPFIRCTTWSNLHGAGLAAAGHLLQGTIDSITIAASYGHGRLIPWGSRPDTDPDWSSDSFRVNHGDASQWRHERLASIASHPLVRRHLRVCTKTRVAAGNCSTCRKCLLTMTQLSAIGELEASRAFDHSVPLASRLNKLKRIERRMVVVWRNLLSFGSLPPDVAGAVVRLVERS